MFYSDAKKAIIMIIVVVLPLIVVFCHCADSILKGWDYLLEGLAKYFVYAEISETQKIFLKCL